MKRSIYISRKVLNSNEIHDWARTQGFSSCLPEDKLHVTVAFDYKRHDWGKLPKSPRDRLSVAGPVCVAEFKKGAIVLTLSSQELDTRWEELREWGLYWKWPDYRPHVTFTYCVPDHIDITAIECFPGEVVLGPEELVEVTHHRQHEVDEIPLH